jgi:hypothetical protein
MTLSLITKTTTMTKIKIKKKTIKNRFEYYESPLGKAVAPSTASVSAVVICDEFFESGF